jgi:hypothetical protein
MMTKRDFEMVARVLNGLEPRCREAALFGFGSELVARNPRFDLEEVL